MTTTPVAELPAWPDRDKYGGKDGRAAAIAKITDGWQGLSEMWSYERARAAYWEARARLAVEALNLIRAGEPYPSGVALAAWKRIGPLPPLPPKEGE